MDKITELKLTDYSVIVNATPKYPEITVENSVEYLKYLHSNYIRTKAELDKLKELIRVNELECNKAKEEFKKLAELFDIEYGTITKEHVTHTVNIGIQGMGNDILGKMK